MKSLTKKINIVIVFSLLFSCLNTYAASDDIIGHVYSTDITAYIDDMPIPCYNINGETVVSEKDLINYGFDVVWDAKKGDLSITNNKIPSVAPEVTVTKKKAGLVLGKVYRNSQVTYVNNQGIDSYNTGGETMIPLEILGHVSNDREYTNVEGYSCYGFKTIWNAEDRTLHVYSMRMGNSLSTTMGTFKIAGNCFYSIPGYYLSKDSGGDSVCDHDTQIGYKKLSSLLDDFYISYTWESGVLVINEPSIKKEVTMKFHPDRNVYLNILYPIIEIPVRINADGKIIEKTVHALMYENELHLSIDDFNQIILKSW